MRPVSAALCGILAGCGSAAAPRHGLPTMEIGAGRGAFVPMPPEGATLDVFCGLQGLHHAFVSTRMACDEPEQVDVRLSLVAGDSAVLARGGRAGPAGCVDGWSEIVGIPLYFAEWSARTSMPGVLGAEASASSFVGLARATRSITTAASPLPCGASDP